MGKIAAVSLDARSLVPKEHAIYRIPVQSVALVRDRTVTVEGRPSAMNAGDVVKLLRPLFETTDREVFVVLALDGRNRCRGINVCAVGGQSACLIDKVTVLRYAILSGASAIIVAHNHPGGDPTPSSADVSMTRDLEAACSAIGVQLVDHVVIADDGHTSFLEAGLLS